MIWWLSQLFDWSLLCHIPSAASEPGTTTFCLWSFQLPIYNAENIQLQSALDDKYNNFSRNTTVLLIHSGFAKKRCNTSQGFCPFFFQSCGRLLFLFSLSRFFSFFLYFLFTSDCVLNQLCICIFQILTEAKWKCGILSKKCYFSKHIIVQFSPAFPVAM